MYMHTPKLIKTTKFNKTKMILVKHEKIKSTHANNINKYIK